MTEYSVEDIASLKRALQSARDEYRVTRSRDTQAEIMRLETLLHIAHPMRQVVKNRN